MALYWGLETLIHRALAQKSEELDTREKLVTEREKKVDHILKNVQTQGCVKLQVGSVFYDIAADVLLSNKESYFHGLLNPKFSQDKEVHFISRDGDLQVCGGISHIWETNFQSFARGE